MPPAANSYCFEIWKLFKLNNLSNIYAYEFKLIHSPDISELSANRRRKGKRRFYEENPTFMNELFFLSI